MTIPEWELLVPGMTEDHLGLLPFMLDENDPASAREQFDRNYQHGGGWRSSSLRFQLTEDDWLLYSPDPPLPPVARTRLRQESIVLYPHAWVAIIQPDRSFEACRMD